MKIGLIDVDGHNFPNMALMKISAWHKAQGDTVEWWWSDFEYYDIVYKSKIFSDAYTKDKPDPMNCGKVIKGGTGYQIHLVNGKEVYDKETDTFLPPEVERMFPDYSIYPQYDFAITMTTRGCPNGCAFCHVSAKEGKCAIKVANVSDFWNGQKKIVALEANLTACAEKRDLFQQFKETQALINFSQGLDVRLMSEEDIEDLNAMRLKDIHFAWDNPKVDLTECFRRYAAKTKHRPHGSFGTVYVLTNFNSTMEENLHRIYTLRDLGFDPDVRIYDKPHAPREVRMLQRWCNNKLIFKSVPKFEDYDPKRG